MLNYILGVLSILFILYAYRTYRMLFILCTKIDN